MQEKSSKSMKTIIIIALAVIILGIIITLVSGGSFYSVKNTEQKSIELPERNDTVPQVPFLHNYGTKIVYTEDTTIPKEIYINDCKTRGGVFNTCGSPCPPEGKSSGVSCVAVCALTCSVK